MLVTPDLCRLNYRDHQFVLVIILPIDAAGSVTPPTPEATVSSGKKKGIRGMAPNLVAFFAYCAVEASTGLWAASFLVEQRGLRRVLAAGGASAYYLGITLGRFLNGFLSSHFEAKSLIRGGQTMILLGVVLMFLPLPVLSLAGLMIIGLGCAPVYPTLLHETPRRFGAENSTLISTNRDNCGLTHAASSGSYHRSLRYEPLSPGIVDFGIAAGVQHRASQSHPGRANCLSEST